MKFENIVCIGANKGIFVRGLPEMPIENVQMENLSLQSEIGAELIDAKGISIKNASFNCEKTKPIISISNGIQLSFEGIQYPNTDLLFSIGGDRTQGIKLKNIDFSKAKSKAEFVEGASEKQMILN